MILCSQNHITKSSYLSYILHLPVLLKQGSSYPQLVNETVAENSSLGVCRFMFWCEYRCDSEKSFFGVTHRHSKHSNARRPYYAQAAKLKARQKKLEQGRPVQFRDGSNFDAEVATEP